MKQTSLKSQQNLVEKVNSAYPVGSKVHVRQDDGSIEEWEITHPASLLGGHTAVIWTKEHVGCYLAERVIF